MCLNKLYERIKQYIWLRREGDSYCIIISYIYGIFRIYEDNSREYKTCRLFRVKYRVNHYIFNFSYFLQSRSKKRSDLNLYFINNDIINKYQKYYLLHYIKKKIDRVGIRMREKKKKSMMYRIDMTMKATSNVWEVRCFQLKIVECFKNKYF